MTLLDGSALLVPSLCSTPGARITIRFAGVGFDWQVFCCCWSRLWQCKYLDCALFQQQLCCWQLQGVLLLLFTVYWNSCGENSVPHIVFVCGAICSCSVLVGLVWVASNALSLCICSWTRYSWQFQVSAVVVAAIFAFTLLFAGCCGRWLVVFSLPLHLV